MGADLQGAPAYRGHSTLRCKIFGCNMRGNEWAYGNPWRFDSGRLPENLVCSRCFRREPLIELISDELSSGS